MLFRFATRWMTCLGWSGLWGILLTGKLSGADPGTLDTSFNAPGTSGGRYITGLPAGKLLVSGPSLTVGAPVSAVRGIARFESTGAVDTTFNAASFSAASVEGHAVRPDGRVLVFGNFSSVGGHSTRGVAMLQDNGSIDLAFQVTAAWTDAAHLILPYPDNSSLVAYRRGQLIRISATGAVDPGFAPNPPLKQLSFGAALQPSGKVLILQSGRVFRLLANGAVDDTYTVTTMSGMGIEYGTYAMAPDGSLYITSNTAAVNDGELRTVVRLLPDGGVDPGFKFAADGTTLGSRQPLSIARDSLGRLYVMGIGFPVSGLQRFLPGGQADPTFPNYGTPLAFAFDTAGQVLMSGTYIQITPVFLFKSGLLRLFNDTVPPGPQKPSIYSDPTPVSVTSGDAATFQVGATGEEPLAFHWLRGATEVATTSVPKLVLDPARAADAGDYRVIVSNAQGSVTSAPVALTVQTQPKISVDPVGFTAPEGVTTNLTAALRGEPPLSLQWYRNEEAVAGGTLATLSFAPLNRTDSGPYRLVVSNASGGVTSSVARVQVLASLPEWLVHTNVTSAATLANPANPFRPDTALQVAHDGLRGAVVLYARGLERWNDAGERLWTIPYTEADFGALSTMTLAPDGSVYVAGSLHFVGKLGDLSMTNNSSVSGPNGHVQAFIAKVDVDGHGLWYRLYEAAGPRIGGLAVDNDGGVVFAGGNGGRNGLSRLGSMVVSESEYAGAVSGKISTNGTPVWFRGFQQFTVNRSTCEADSVAVDSTGIYLTGLISFSIQFGNFQLQNIGPNALNWIGKLETNGEPKWIRAAGGQPWQGAPIVAGGGRRWFLLPRERVLQSWSADGSLLATVNAVLSSYNDSAVVRQLGVTAKGEPMLIGSSAGRTAVAGTELNPGQARPQVWFGMWDADGKALRGRVLATTTNVNPAFASDSVSAAAFAAGANGDALVAGASVYAMRFLGRDYVAPTGSVRGDGRPSGAFLAKIAQPAYTPEITQQPIAAYSMDTGGSVRIGIQASGPGPLTYQWRHDGQPVAGATTNTFDFVNAKFADGGRYDVVVSNPYGSVISEPSVITVRPPFTIRTQPGPQLVLLDGTVLSGSAIDAAAIQSSVLPGKTLEFTVTNSTTPRFAVGAKFAMTFTGLASGGTYRTLAGGALPERGDSYATLFSIPDLTNLRLVRLNGTDLATLGLQLLGRFDLHYDIVGADGCCAVGTFTEAGGAATATFSVQTTFFVPAGNYQWQKDGQDLPNQTAATLTLPNVTAADAGFYRCVITYKDYTETSQPAELRVVGGGTPPVPPVLSFAPFQPGANGLTIPVWPAGFILQRTASLSPAVWETYAVSGPVTLPIAAPGEFFRLAPAP